MSITRRMIITPTMSITRTMLGAGALLVLASGPAVSVALADWQGEMSTADGVIRVLNPETPAEGESSVELNELWRLGGEDEDILFGVIAEFLHDDDGNIYLLDSQLSEIQVFDRDGTWLRTVGREGEGPGEFRNGADMFWTPGGELGVVQAWPGKVVMVMPDGTPGGVFALPFRDGMGFQSVSRGAGTAGRMILAGTAWSNENGEQTQTSYLKAYDVDGQELASFHELTREQNYGGWEFKEELFADFKRRWAAAEDGRVAAALSFDEYRIHVWKPDGSLDRIIERPDYGPVRRTDAEKKRFQAMYDRFTSWNPGSTFRVSDVHPAIGQIMFREDGSLWVQSGRDMWRNAEDRYTAFDVYDREGRYVRRVALLADADAVEDGLFFAGDRAFIVTDLFSALMASVGGDEINGAYLDAEPVSVIAFEFAPLQLEVPGTH